MKKLTFFLLLIILVISGCAKSTVNNETQAKKTTSHPAHTSTNNQGDTYQSITQFHEIITGENLKTGALHITKQANIITFNMDYKYSDKLKSIMSKTRNKFYLTFAEVDGQNKLNGLFAENTQVVVGNALDMHITQTMKIKANLTPKQIQIAMTPANYELVFLNEQYQKVAVVIGLDLSTLNQ